MRFKFILTRKPFIYSVVRNRVTSCDRSVTTCVCCAQMDTSKPPSSSAIVKKCVPFLPFSGVPRASDTSTRPSPADTSESSSSERRGIDAEVAESSLKSLLGIGSTARTTEPAACKLRPSGLQVYGPPKSQAFQPRGSDVSTEDPAILDWKFEQKEEAALVEGHEDLPRDSAALEFLISSAAEATAEEDCGRKVNVQNAGASSTDTGIKQSRKQKCEGAHATRDRTSSCFTMETSTPVPDKTKKAKAKKRRRRKKRAAVALQPSVSLGEDNSESEDLSHKEQKRCHERVSIESEGSDDEECLLAHLPQAVDSSAESESEDGVYSLKPLFTGAYDVASKKGKRRKRQYSDSADKRQRPNYFVAVQTRNREVHENIEKVLEHIRSCEPTLSKAFVATSTLHLTMLVLRVSDNDDSLERAKEALVRSYNLLRDDLNSNPLVLNFRGLRHFKNEVLFAKVEGEEPKERLKKIAEVCLKEFTSSNLDLTGHKEFKPHLTLIKLSKTSKHTCKIRKIQKEWYEKFAEESFGSQAVFSLQLLSMNKPKDENGYYYCSQECRFENVPVEDNTKHSPGTSSGGSAGSSPLAKRKLLELESAKEDIRRSISSLTKAKLDEITASTAEQHVMQIDVEHTEKEERKDDRVTTGAADAAFPAKTEPPEVTCAALPDQ